VSKKVVFPYKPRRLWATKLHPEIDRHRFSVLVMHRRFGKTVGTLNHMIMKAVQCELRSPQYAYIAPFRNQAKQIAWTHLKYYTGVVPGIKVNETNLYVEFPSIVQGSTVGARIQIVGADHPDALRGTYWDGVILDEFAQIKPELWSEVIRPSLADRKGWAIFIGTPKGQNAFYDKYREAVREYGENPGGEWYADLVDVDHSGVLDAAEVESMKKEMTDIEIRQELYCDFTASAFNVVIPLDVVYKCQNFKVPDAVLTDRRYVLGVDIARYGDDDSVIWRRRGAKFYKPTVIHGADTMEMADRIAYEIDECDPVAVFIDEGSMGAGVIDRLNQMGYRRPVIPIAFGSRAMNSKRYINARSEMYFRLLAFLSRGAELPGVPGLKEELSVTEYRFKPTGQIALIEKETIKNMLGRSPDLADGLALTVARDVREPALAGRSVRKLAGGKRNVRRWGAM